MLAEPPLGLVVDEEQPELYKIKTLKNMQLAVFKKNTLNSFPRTQRSYFLEGLAAVCTIYAKTCQSKPSIAITVVIFE